jgi:HEAT repeat protein
MESELAHAFISYVRENSPVVDRLANELRAHGVTVWLDRNNIEPGARWHDAIKNAIRGGKYFIACISQESNARDRTYMREEITLAREELRLRPSDTIWFIPVLLNDTTIPSLSISKVEDLSDLNFVKLYEDWDKGIDLILRVLEHDNKEAVRVRKLIEIVEQPFADERLHAIRQLGTMGTLAKKAVSVLIKASKENNAEIKKSSLEALGEIGPAAAAAVPAVVAALSDADNGVRWNAAGALEKLGPAASEAVPALIAALNDRNQGIQWRASGALAKIGRDAVAALAAALDDPDKVVRRRAADTLGMIGPAAAEAVPALTTALKDSDAGVRWNAADAISRIQGEL